MHSEAEARLRAQAESAAARKEGLEAELQALTAAKCKLDAQVGLRRELSHNSCADSGVSRVGKETS